MTVTGEVEGGLVSGAGAIQELTLHFRVNFHLCEPYVIETYFEGLYVVQSKNVVMFCLQSNTVDHTSNTTFLNSETYCR